MTPFQLPEKEHRQLLQLAKSKLQGKDEEVVEAVSCVAGWLRHLGIFTDAQVFHAAGELVEIVTRWVNDLKKSQTVKMFTVLEGRYLVVLDERWRSFLDLDSLQYVDEIQTPPLTTVGCNFNELLRRHLAAAGDEAKEG